MTAMIALLVLGAAAPAPAVQAEATPRSTLEALLSEVRLLRVALERQSAAGARAQVLMGRLTLQAQRVSTLQAEERRLGSESSRMTANRVLVEGRLNEARATLEQAREPEAVASTENEIRQIEAHLRQERAQQGAIDAQRAEVVAALETERARYEEISDRLDRLERELERPSR